MSPIRTWMIAACFLPAAALDARASDQVSAAELLEQSELAGAHGKHDEAIKLATLAIQRAPAAADGYYVRGRQRFRAGQVRESVADFDRYVQLRPEAASRQWERGIACFYAGMHEEGARQFESYQKFHSEDVENSVWRFLCLVPQVGVQRAQASILAIEGDRRVPMMQVYDLFRGKLPPEDVLAAARAGDPADDVLVGRLFYAHLYLGLWHDANGNTELARHYIGLAADENLRENGRINQYMWDVARVHARRLKGEL